MGNKSVKTRRENSKRVVEYYDESGNKTKTHIDGEPAWRNNNPGNIKWDGKRDPGFFKDRRRVVPSWYTPVSVGPWGDGGDAAYGPTASLPVCSPRLVPEKVATFLEAGRRKHRYPPTH